MRKPFTVSEDKIQHYDPPELRGRIVGLSSESLRPQTVEEIEALQRQAYEEAKQEGRAEGVKLGREEVSQELEEMKLNARQLKSMFDFLHHPLEEMDKDVEHQLADLAIELAKNLLKKESALDAQHIHTLVHESLDYLPVKAREIRVRLNPDDIALLNQAEIDTNNQSWTCIADSTVSAGGCVIESDTSHIDATVETRVQQLVDQFSLHQLDDINRESDDAAE